MSVNAVLLASAAGIVGIALGYYLRLIISLGKRGSMELEIKSMELAATEEAKKITLRAQEEAAKVREEARIELKEKEEKPVISQATLNRLSATGVPNDVALDIQGALNQGFTADQIKEGLRNANRDPALVDKFLEEMRKAGEAPWAY